MELEHGDNEYKGLKINIETDTDTESPREWDNLGSMYCEHNRYDLGDISCKDIRLNKQFKGIILPLYLYDHSGITMSVGTFSCPWDSGQVGYIYVSDEKIRDEYGVKRISKKLREKITKYLIGEVETYDMYLTGEIYGYTIENSNDEHLDSCWGFYGMKDVSEQAIQAADSILNEIKTNKQNQIKIWIRNRVPLENRI